MNTSKLKKIKVFNKINNNNKFMSNLRDSAYTLRQFLTFKFVYFISYDTRGLGIATCWNGVFDKTHLMFLFLPS